MTKAISFLGTTRYELTTYRYKGVDAQTRYFAAALPHLFSDIDSVLVFVTPTVQHHTNFEALHEELGDRLKPVGIPEGHSEQDLWTIFDCLTGEVDSGDQVIFDITNSFRSLPLLCFLAATYVRTALNVNVQAIVYGAYEARSPQNISPVFDLTSFIGLLDWTTATDQFIQTGDARRLAQLLNPSQAAEGPAARASQTLSTVSLAAFLCQPFLLMPEAYSLSGHLKAAEAQLYAEVRPYQTLQKRIVDEFGSFGAVPDADAAAQLQAQFRMIKWYKRNRQLIQAVTLAREWLISTVTVRLRQPIDVRSEPRKQMELAVSGLSLIGRRKVRDEQGKKRMFDRRDLNVYGQQIYDSWPEYEQIRRLWDKLSLVRNSLDHAGYQSVKLSVDEMVALVDQEIMPGLGRLATAWGFTGEPL